MSVVSCLLDLKHRYVVSAFVPITICCSLRTLLLLDFLLHAHIYIHIYYYASYIALLHLPYVVLSRLQMQQRLLNKVIIIIIIIAVIIRHELETIFN